MIEIILSLLLIAAGAAFLAKGSGWLVNGAAGLALRLGLSTLVVGITVVGFGTSTPELVTSLIGGSTIAIGNVAGSNLLNLGFVLGITALIAPIACKRRFMRFEVPLMVLLGPGMLAATWSGLVTRLEGILLVLVLFLFLWMSLKRGRVERTDEEKLEIAETGRSIVAYAGLVLLGLLVLLVGGKLLVEGAIRLAVLAGITERIIALTIVAGGTSLPELATCVAAARRGHGDMAIGNLVGSNIFNILAILGIVAIVTPIAVPNGSNSFDIPAMIAMQVIAYIVMRWQMNLSRLDGLMLLLCYLAYVVTLFVMK